MNHYNFEVLIINYYYLVFVMFALFANSMLIYLIRYRSPYSLHGFKLLLINTAVNQILLALTAGFLQERMLPCDSVLALLPVGPCRYFGPITCFVAYNTANALNLNIGISVLHSMYYRYRLIRATQLSSTRVRTNLLVTAIIPLFLAVSPYIVPFRFDLVMEVAMRKHPEFNLKEYGPFGGFQSTTNPVFIINSAILYATAVALPIVILYWRYHILKALNTSEGVFAEKTRNNSRLLLKALTVQAVMPLLCYVPMGLLYFVAQFSGYHFMFLEYSLPIFTTLPCAIDPLVTIYFITPYRIWIIKRIRAHIAPVRSHNNRRSTVVSVAARSVKVG